MGQLLLIPDPKPLVERLGGDFFKQLPARPGVYLMRDASEVVLYVGKARNLKKRLNSYRVANPIRFKRRHLRLLRLVARIELHECPDEDMALVKEAELLRTLKPRFNRAGVWPARAQFLAWRWDGRILALAIMETPATGWQAFGPSGRGMVYLRAALARLLWYALNPASGSATMPEGWMRGRLSAVATVPMVEPISSGVKTVLEKLFGGDVDGFVAWIGVRTKSLVKKYDLETRDADLESVLKFMQAKVRQTLPFASPGHIAAAKRVVLDSMLPFADEACKLP